MLHDEGRSFMATLELSTIDEWYEKIQKKYQGWKIEKCDFLKGLIYDVVRVFDNENKYDTNSFLTWTGLSTIYGNGLGHALLESVRRYFCIRHRPPGIGALGFGFKIQMYNDENMNEDGSPKTLKLGIWFDPDSCILSRIKALQDKWKTLYGEKSVEGDFLLIPEEKLKNAEDYQRDDDSGSTGKRYYRILTEVLKELLGDGRMTPKELAELVEARKQLILNGAPGTGKTYTADIIAKMIVLGKTEEEVKNLGEEDKKQITERTKKVQFHPGYDYSDFIIGLKPALIQDDKTIYTEPIPQPEYDKNAPTELVERKLKKEVTLAYAWQNGVFKEFAEKAAENKKEKGVEADNFVFIIDEINRADLSNVFGEAFSRLEADYRGEDVILPSGHRFQIPENLYIIGTMNDIDRSVESMDFALRRRFAWHEIEAEESVHIIKNKVPEDKREKFKPVIEALQEAMMAINDIIAGKNEKVDDILKNLGLGTEYQLGGAYFAPGAENYENFNPDDEEQRNNFRDDLWNHHIKVILNDYLRGNKNKKEAVGSFYQAYKNAFNKKFNGQNKGDAQTPK